MAQFIHIDTLTDMFRSRPDIVTELNKRIAAGNEAYTLVQAENADALVEANGKAHKAAVRARIARCESDFEHELEVAKSYISDAVKNEAWSGFGLIWKGLCG